MSLTSLPQLDWIDIEKVVQFAQHRFGKAVRVVHEDLASASRVEPTLALVRAGILGQPVVLDDAIDVTVSITKTIQNAVGYFHQDVLGEVDGWASTGAAGGAVDLHGFSPVTEKRIVAELKMRWNTIKASDEAGVWDGLKHAATVTGSDTVAYIFQVVPKTNEPYDRPWKVSGRESLERVRAADGVTAYHLVTGRPKALFELLEALPYVLTRVADSLLGDSRNTQIAFRNNDEIVRKVISGALPLRSAYATTSSH